MGLLLAAPLSCTRDTAPEVEARPGDTETVEHLEQTEQELIEADGRAGQADGPVAILQSWQGDFPVDQLHRLPRDQRETPAGWIGDPHRFQRLWQAFQPETDVPEVDFDTHIVVFTRNTQFYNRTNIFKVELKDGVAEVLAMQTMSARPIEENVAMALAVIPRAGVKAIKSNEGDIPVSDGQ
jgi:hypothetical protein